MQNHAIDEREQSTLLVVDDTPENIDVLRGVLKPHYKVKVAINGEQALKQAVSANPPDLILLDVMMPGLDGYEVCRRLKANPATEGIPVIFVTALNETPDELLGFEVGGVDFINKPITPATVLARVKTHLQLRSAYDFIRDTFGRYLSDEIVDTLINSPQGLKLGGEKRDVTILMSDLRGFTSIAESLPAETVVDMINIFLGEMTEVIQHFKGTIDEFIGDAILAIFGAPVQRDDDALRAVQCAVRMQLAMEKVNAIYCERGYPEVEMGVGINSGEVIVGNIGSKLRSKYAVVGRHVNTTSRIESYTLGGQVLISESTRDACAAQVEVRGEMRVMPKGVNREMSLFDVAGVTVGAEKAELPPLMQIKPETLLMPVAVSIMRLEGKHARSSFNGSITAVGERVFEIDADELCANLTDLRISLNKESEQGDFYGKVVEQTEEGRFVVYATSIPQPAASLMAELF